MLNITEEQEERLSELVEERKTLESKTRKLLIFIIIFNVLLIIASFTGRSNMYFSASTFLFNIYYLIVSIKCRKRLNAINKEMRSVLNENSKDGIVEKVEG